MDNKMLDLSKLDDKTFAEVRDSLNRWIDSGMTTSVGYISEEDVKKIEETIANVYNRGVYEGAIALCVGFAAGYGISCLIEKALKRYISKKEAEKID